MQVFFDNPYVLLFIAYLCGSAPVGYFFGKIVKGRGFDIRDWGSTNIGFTNVWGVLGIKVALPVLLMDVAKGAVPTWLCMYYFGTWLGVAAWFLSVIGHWKSLYFFVREGKFSGGKSVATMFGGLIPLQPYIAVPVFLVWAIVLFRTKYMSLASMSGALMAFLASIFLHFFVLHLNAYWIPVLFGAFLLIAFTHARNIGRLIEGTEPKVTENRGAGGYDPKNVIVAFGAHLLTITDLSQAVLSAWIVKLVERGAISERNVRRIIRYMPVMESDMITGIEIDGRKVTVLLMGIPLLPEQIKDPKYLKLVNALLKVAAVQAQRRGAVAFGLGALLSTLGDGGAELQSWAEKRGLMIQCDNGAKATAAATLIAIRRAAKKPLSECKVAVVGASGFIGSAIVRTLEQEVPEIMLFGKKERKMEGEKTLHTILNFEKESQLLSSADIVVLTTSAQGFIINKDNASLIKYGALVLDIAVPGDFDSNVLEDRPDITLIRSGLIDLPGKPVCKTDFHFGSVEDGGSYWQLFPACLAEIVMLGLSRDNKNASIGRIVRANDVLHWEKELKRWGMKIITTDVCEGEIFHRN